MTGFVIEAGIYFLLVFIPFAFGGVEGWAKGILQIVAGVVVAAWALERPDPRLGIGREAVPRGERALWVAIALFVVLVACQMIPLSSSWIRTIAPGVHDVYARTLPGYASGRETRLADLPTWLLDQKRSEIPAPAETLAAAGSLAPPFAEERFPPTVAARRTLSLNPFETGTRLSLLLSYAGIFAVVASHYRTRDRLGRLLAALAFAALTLSLVGIMQKFTWNGKLLWLREGNYISPFGPFVNRNSYAAFAGTVLPVAVCMGLGALRGLEKGRRDALPRLLMWSFAAVTTGCGVFLSLSRGGILSVSFSLALIGLFLAWYGRKAADLAVIAVLVLGTVLLLVWLGPEDVIERVGTLSEGTGVPTLAHRIGAWEHAIEMIRDHTLIGTGLGTFRFGFMRYAPPGEGWWTTAHNEYIEIVCDTGIAGAAIVLAGSAIFLLLVWRPGLFRGKSTRYAYVGIVSGMAGLLLHSAVSSNLQVPANGLLLTILGGALIGLVSSARPRGDGRGVGAGRARNSSQGGAP